MVEMEETALLSFEEIKMLYPNEWVLIAEPEFVNTEIQGGIVLLHGKDRREIAYSGRDLVKNYESYTLRFTGDFPKNRRIWL